jgi:hypothetical protein
MRLHKHYTTIHYTHCIYVSRVILADCGPMHSTCSMNRLQAVSLPKYTYTFRSARLAQEWLCCLALSYMSQPPDLFTPLQVCEAGRNGVSVWLIWF